MEPELEIWYPVPEQKIVNMLKLRRYVFRMFTFAGISCIIINICTGGRAWSVVTAVSLWLFWKNALEKVLVEDSAAERTSRFCMSTCVLLLMVELSLGVDCAAVAVPVLLLCALAALVLNIWINNRGLPSIKSELEKRLHR